MRPDGPELTHRHERSEEFVLTPLQRGFLAESLVASDPGVNVEQIVWELDRVPDVERFRAAWQSALDGFDALRLSFIWPGPGEKLRQSVRAPVRLPFQRVELPECPPGQHDARLEGFLALDRRAGLDLKSTPLMRVSLVVMRSRAVSVWTVHHAVIDGNSYASVLQRVLDAYDGPHRPVQGPAVAAPQFRDFLRWLERQDPEPGARHFAELLRGFDEPTPLPLQESAVSTAVNRSSLTSLHLDPETTAGLEAAAKATGTTPNTLVQLAWALLLSRYSGSDDVLFGATWSGRAGTIDQSVRVVGPFVNTLPVRVRLSEAGTLRELAAALRRQHLALRPFQQTALGDIRARSDLAGFAQLFGTSVVFENERFYSTLSRQDSRWLGHKLWSRSQTSLPLVLAAYFQDGVLVTDLEHDVALYPHDTARRLLSDYRRLLASIPLSLDASPYEVPMLDESTRAQLTVTEAARELSPARRSAIERVLDRASSSPHATAVREYAGREVSYAELEGRVRRLAAVLRARGVERGSLVGILLPRSIDAVVSLLAVHAAGGAFVPLDPAAPSRRLEFIVRDSGTKVVLVGGETRGRLESAADVELDIESPVVTRGNGLPVPVDPPEPTSVAYVIYTSGSSGEPKGVCVPHEALANHLEETLGLYALGPCDKVLQFAPLVFDVCLEEILPTLAAGATLVLRSDEMVASARGFLDAVASAGLTVLNLPTAFWHQLVRAEHGGWPSCLRLVVVGGEQASPEAHRRFRAAGTGHIRWLNAYGPTEAAITSTCYDDAQGDHTSGFVPIGRPLPGVSHFVFDPHMRLAPLGQPGQLYIGGAALASGYLNRADLTRERFVPHPFRQGARLYATGDRVRRTGAGNYVYLGRLDDQVKVRGYRVELGEIEARLRQHSAVGDAAVVMRKREGEESSLVAFVVADLRVVAAAELKEHVATSLPSYMVPARVVIAPELPTTPSGKIDRKALAEPEPTRTGEPGVPASADEPVLRTLFQIWTGLLGSQVTDAEASFFDLGGDSLLVVEMFSEVERHLGMSSEAAAFFKSPTIGNLAKLLRPATRMGWSAPLLVLAPGETAVRPLFLAPALSGRGTDYVHLAAALSPDMPVHALQSRALRQPELAGESFRDAAAYFASLMRDVQPRGPYAVAGFSAGGVLAMAIAEALQECGESTDFVGLVDSTPPRSVPVLSPFTHPVRLARFSRTLVGRMREALGRYRGLRPLLAQVRSAVFRGATRWGIRPEREPSFDELFGGVDGAWTDADRKRARMYFEALWRHEFRGLPIDIVLFRVVLDPFEGPHEKDLGWSRVTTGAVTVEHLPGIHEQVLTPGGARELASHVEPHLRRRAASRVVTTGS